MSTAESVRLAKEGGKSLLETRRSILIKESRHDMDLLLKGLDSLFGNIIADTKRFDPSLLHFFQHAQASDIWIRSVSRAELAGTHSGPAALCITTRARVATSTSGENSGFAHFESGLGYEEYKLESHCSSKYGRHPEIRLSEINGCRRPQ